MSVVEEAVRHWEMFREYTIAELENVPEEHWDFRPEPGARTLRELARHVAESGMLFASELERPDTSFRRLFDPGAREEALKGYAPARTRAELLDLLRRTGEDVARRMRAQGGALESQTMKSRGGDQTKLSGFWFAIAHEMYHRGQITAYERGIGLVPVMTQQAQAAQQGAKR